MKVDKINKIKEYLIVEIRERVIISKTLSKCIAAFNFFDKTLLVLFAASDGFSIASFTTVIGISLEITSVSSALVFSFSNAIAKKAFKSNEKKRKRNTIKFFL